MFYFNPEWLVGTLNGLQKLAGRELTTERAGSVPSAPTAKMLFGTSPKPQKATEKPTGSLCRVTP